MKINTLPKIKQPLYQNLQQSHIKFLLFFSFIIFKVHFNINNVSNLEKKKNLYTNINFLLFLTKKNTMRASIWRSLLFY